jgi:hypothetical protein
MSITKWTCGSMFVVACAATPACGAPADSNESTGRNQTAETKSAEQERIRRTPFCLPGEKVVCTLGPPPVCHCAPAALPIGTSRE